MVSIIKYVALVLGLSCLPLEAADVRILTNHLGYELEGPKRAVVQASEQLQLSTYSLRDSVTQAVVASGEVVFVGAVDKWKDWVFWTISFDQVTRPGTYLLVCPTPTGEVRSHELVIKQDLLERETLSDVLFYFKSQRCDGVKDKADRSVAFAQLPDVRIDAHGGWYDASGDYGKHLSHLSFSTYFNPQQLPLVVWSLLRSHTLLEARQERNFRQYLRRMLDEAMVGADYLVRVHRSGGSFYRTVQAPGFEKAPQDRVIGLAMRSFAVKQHQRHREDAGHELEHHGSKLEHYEVGFRAGGGVAIAALARAATQPVSGELSSATYLEVAEETFAYLQEHNLSSTNDGRENIVDDYCALLAATELALATDKQEYRRAARLRAQRLCDRLVSWKSYRDYFRADDRDRPFFHAADAGLPVVALLCYLDIAQEQERDEVLRCVRRALEHELRITREVANPFGYARQLVQSVDGRRRSSFFYPHDTETAPWWQGENARLGSLAAAARLAARWFADDEEFVAALRSYAADQLNWVLGLNPFDACMLHGSGRNNPPYLFFGYYEYTNSPGGICNGITAGLEDEANIDFNLPYAVTGKDYDWRWGEQWLPHASWYLLAVAAR